MFRRVLIANRGEIALRVARACAELGVETVMVHSEADRGAPWLEHASDAVCIGPARSVDSYLNQGAILQAAEQTECQALHPGYGFLAENAQFAARCEQQGLTFIGPSAAAIRRMGDKAQAKRTMASAGLPTIPGSRGVLPGVDQAREEAERIGYPVLLKATAGGGGRGMRRCDDPGELASAFDEARIEAEKSFGNPAVYLEKFVVGGRHIEFQVLADGRGAAVHLGERECSIQRQHQKLVEEAPSPVVDEATRRELGGRVACAVAGFGYRGAGTVEFLRSPEGRFYFMEMNTRLQVEHPVTEMLTGTDLVAEQLRIAANAGLGLDQETLRFDGHAIEFRINAEDPQRGFRPGPGKIVDFRPPPEKLDGARVRWDSAVRSDYVIPPHYDSMIGKLIVHAADREAAMAAGRIALESLGVGGVPTTIGFHRELLDDPAFRSGEYDVDFLHRRGSTANGESPA